MQTQLRPNLALFANLTYENRRYNAPEGLFLQTRNDQQSNVGLGLDWEFAAKWRLMPQVFVTHNASNIPIYGLNRDVYSLVLRREF